MGEEQPPSRPNWQQEHRFYERITMSRSANSIDGVQLQVEGTPGRSGAPVTRLNRDSAREPNDEDGGRPGAAYNLSELLPLNLVLLSFNDDVLCQEKVPAALVHETSTSCTEDRLLRRESLFQGINRYDFSFYSLTNAHNPRDDEAKLHWFIVVTWEQRLAKVFTTSGIQQWINKKECEHIDDEEYLSLVSEGGKISSPYPLVKGQVLSSIREFFSMVNRIFKTDFQVIPVWLQDVVPVIGENCVICFNVLENGDCVQLECSAKHKFHPQCIVECTLKSYERCPLCRAAVMLYFPFAQSVRKEKPVLIHP